MLQEGHLALDLVVWHSLAGCPKELAATRYTTRWTIEKRRPKDGDGGG